MGKSKFVGVVDDDLTQDAILKQLKLIKVHLEVQTGEVLELPLNDDDDAGSQ
jgi:hypothetical protein